MKKLFLICSFLLAFSQAYAQENTLSTKFPSGSSTAATLAKVGDGLTNVYANVPSIYSSLVAYSSGRIVIYSDKIWRKTSSATAGTTPVQGADWTELYVNSFLPLSGGGMSGNISFVGQKGIYGEDLFFSGTVAGVDAYIQAHNGDEKIFMSLDKVGVYQSRIDIRRNEIRINGNTGGNAVSATNPGAHRGLVGRFDYSANYANDAKVYPQLGYIWKLRDSLRIEIAANSGGTANDADSLAGQPGAYYLDRANHTGTFPANSVGNAAISAVDFSKTYNRPTTKAGYGISDISNVDNTSDVNKPVSTAQQAALNLKADSTYSYPKSSLNTLLAAKEPIIIAGTTLQYIDGTKAKQTFSTSVRRSAIGSVALPISTSALSVTDSIPVAFGKVQGQINAIAASKRPLGDIYNLAPNASSSSLYADTSPQTTFTFTSSGITASLGNNDALNFLEYSSYYTNAAFYTRTMRIVCTADGNGIGIGIHSGNGDILARIITATTINRGKLLVDSYRSGVLSNRVTSSGTLTYTNGDIIDLIFERNLTSYRITAKNITTSTSTVPVFATVEYIDPLAPFNGNTWAVGRPAIYHFGGSQTILNDAYSIREIVSNEVVVYGNSLSAGFYAGGAEYMMYSVLKSSIVNGVGLIAGGGNKTSDYANLKAEIFSLKPKVIIFADGINDIINGVSASTTQANILAFIADCQAAGVTPVLSEVLPISSTFTPASGTNASAQTAIDALNTWMNTLGVKVVPANAVLKSAGSLNSIYDSGDGLHINAFGNIAWATTIISSIKTLVNATPAPVFGYTMPANAGVTFQIVNPQVGTGSSASIRTTSDAAQGFFGTYSSTHSLTGYANKSLLSNNNGGLILAASGASGGIELLTGGLTIGTNRKWYLNNTGSVTQSGDAGNNPISLDVQNNNAGGNTFTGATANITVKHLAQGGNANFKAINDVGAVSQITTAGSNTTLTNFFATGSSVWYTNQLNMYLGNINAAGELNLFAGGNTPSFIRGKISAAGNWRIGSNTTATEKLDVEGNVWLTTAGNKLKIKSGTNASVGTASLSAGTATISTTAVAANSIIFLTVQSLGTVTAPKTLAVTTKTAGTSFVISSEDVTDTSTVAWWIVDAN